MAYFAKNTQDDLDETDTELLPAVRQSSDPQIVFPQDGDMAPTRADLAYGYAGAYPVAQSGGYLSQVLPADQFSRLMGPAPLPTPRPLVKVSNFFTHLYQSRALPGLGVLALAGVSVWAHGETDHQWWGGGIITTGAWLVRSGVVAHRKHGADVDYIFTRGAAATGVLAMLIGTGVTAGMSRWMAVAVVIATAAGYVVDAGVRHLKLEALRRFVVGIVAAGNTGPTPPGPAALAWGGPVSDEEYRLRQAFTKLKAPEVELTPVRRINADTWYLFADFQNTGTTAEAIEKDLGRLAEWAGARRIEALPGNRSSQRKLIIHDGDDPLADPIMGPGPRITSILEPARIGLFEDLTEVLQVLAFNHGLDAGATDNGKSGILNAILIATLGCVDVQRILIDCKAGAPEFGVYRPVSFCVADNPQDGMRVLAGLEALYQYRGNLLAEKSVPEEPGDDGIPVRKWRPEFGPFILAAIDELAELTAAVPGAAKQIQRLNALVRYVGIIRIDATQTPSRQVFGGNTDARLNYQFRIGMRTAESGAINMILGQGALGRGWRLDELGDLQGKFMIQSRQHHRPRVARGDFYTDAQIARYIAEYTPFVREHPMDEGSAEAFWEGYHAWGQPEDEGTGGGDGGPRGGKRQEQQDAPVVYGRPHLVVLHYPDGSKIAEEDVALFQLLGEYGREGASANKLAARAKALGHKFNSPPWVLGKLRQFAEKDAVGSRKEGREEVFWRRDLRSEAVRDGAAS